MALVLMGVIANEALWFWMCYGAEIAIDIIWITVIALIVSH